MKTLFPFPKTINLILVIVFISLGTSCKDKKSNKKGSYDGSSSCELITADNIRSVFDLGNNIEIEQTKKLKEICYYKWQSPNGEKLKYTVRFAFARWAEKSATEMDKTWKSQNKAIYKKHNLQKIPGVGDKASWSDYENGQLRVAADGYMFYISIYIKPKDKNSMDTQEMTDKAVALAKHVVKNM